MKKKVVVVLITALLLTSSVYLFIPSKIIVSNVRYLHAYQNSVIRFFNDSTMLNAWWRQATTPQGNSYSYKGYTYTVTGALSNLLTIAIQNGSKNYKSDIVSLNIYMDSSAIQWSTQITTSPNPFERIKQYNEAKELKDNMTGLANNLKHYLDQTTNLYGIDIKEVKVKDSLLISTKTITGSYPAVNDIYALVKKLQHYAASQHAGISDSAMLNITRLDEKKYQVMAGLPINKLINETADIKIKRLPYMRNLFISTITGGNQTIQHALEKMAEYSLDSRRASPAIPFQLMVTNRLNEPDTTKWVTTLYYPII